ncbi:hypothetical protein AX769_03545 [Frondihabitans sp. PAMC 28766]|uniref:response regulator n=1 Tax=Frondihabitans sp. PAMC 28766 TaxID=1795630 RepID=UPI00078C6BD9|nr:response regulator [Frondihabitans sp. PAMC 28766]AMM19376.1 hypothetical protein AX769_03545 [Frondihabitans sp. PAMC 28766]
MEQRPLAAGTSDYHYRKFLVWNLIGAASWTIIVSTLGVVLGQIPFVRNHIDILAILIVIVSVLPIEDDPALGPLIQEVLEEAYDVDRRIDGREGLIAGLDNDYDVMLIDRRLPSIDGLSIVQSLRQGRVTVLILMLTAYSVKGRT